MTPIAQGVVLNSFFKLLVIFLIISVPSMALAGGLFRIRLKVISYNDSAVKVEVGRSKGSIDKNKLSAAQREKCLNNIGSRIVLKVRPGTIKF